MHCFGFVIFSLLKLTIVNVFFFLPFTLFLAAVEVSEKPKFTMPLSNVMARAGQKFKLECHVKGLPSPTVTWFHNTKPIKETPDCKVSFHWLCIFCTVLLNVQ